MDLRNPYNPQPPVELVATTNEEPQLEPLPAPPPVQQTPPVLTGGVGHTVYLPADPDADPTNDPDPDPDPVPEESETGAPSFWPDAEAFTRIVRGAVDRTNEAFNETTRQWVNYHQQNHADMLQRYNGDQAKIYADHKAGRLQIRKPVSQLTLQESHDAGLVHHGTAAQQHNDFFHAEVQEGIASHINQSQAAFAAQAQQQAIQQAQQQAQQRANAEPLWDYGDAVNAAQAEMHQGLTAHIEKSKTFSGVPAQQPAPIQPPVTYGPPVNATQGEAEAARQEKIKQQFNQAFREGINAIGNRMKTHLTAGAGIITGAANGLTAGVFGLDDRIGKLLADQGLLDPNDPTWKISTVTGDMGSMLIPGLGQVGAALKGIRVLNAGSKLFRGGQAIAKAGNALRKVNDEFQHIPQGIRDLGEEVALEAVKGVLEGKDLTLDERLKNGKERAQAHLNAKLDPRNLPQTVANAAGRKLLKETGLLPTAVATDLALAVGKNTEKRASQYVNRGELGERLKAVNHHQTAEDVYRSGIKPPYDGLEGMHWETFYNKKNDVTPENKAIIDHAIATGRIPQGRLYTPLMDPIVQEGVAMFEGENGIKKPDVWRAGKKVIDQGKKDRHWTLPLMIEARTNGKKMTLNQERIDDRQISGTDVNTNQGKTSYYQLDGPDKKEGLYWKGQYVVWNETTREFIQVSDRSEPPQAWDPNRPEDDNRLKAKSKRRR